MKFKEAFRNKNSFLVFVDLFMMTVLTVNLAIILFDWIFTLSFVNHFLEEHTPDFYMLYYENIHLNFQVIDFWFVVVFLTEFFFSWILAVIQREYYKWFFYPFIHWYDLLGCIPVGSFRFLRVLRIFSILIRLQNLKIIDLSKTHLYGVFKKYYGIVVEEISDRVTVNIIEGVQDEIEQGGPIVDNIITEVIRPKQPMIVEWISRRLEIALERDVLVRKEEIEAYIKRLIADSLDKNAEIQTIEQVPLMGKKITAAIENSISGTINNVVFKALSDLASFKNRELVNDAADLIVHSIEHKDKEIHLNDIFTEISVEILDIVKKQVMVKRWQEDEELKKAVLNKA